MHKIVLQLSVISASLITIACSPSKKEVSFSAQVMPILSENCGSCHKSGGIGYVASGFNVENYESIMKGTKLGPVIQPGVSFASTLHVLVEHKADPSLNMPKDGMKLSEENIEIIGKWIDEGAKNN